MTTTTDDRITIAREADRILDEPTVNYARVGLSDNSSPVRWHELTCGPNILTIDDDGVIGLTVARTELGELTWPELLELRTLLNDPRIGDFLQRIREP